MTSAAHLQLGQNDNCTTTSVLLAKISVFYDLCVPLLLTSNTINKGLIKHGNIKAQNYFYDSKHELLHFKEMGDKRQ